MVFDNANFYEDRAIWGADGDKLFVKVILEQMPEWNKQFGKKISKCSGLDVAWTWLI